jgi:hypothetical protein
VLGQLLLEGWSKSAKLVKREAWKEPPLSDDQDLLSSPLDRSDTIQWNKAATSAKGYQSDTRSRKRQRKRRALFTTALFAILSETRTRLRSLLIVE